jgi:SPX domain protein involved in polyphosphate accumulation
MSNLSQTIRKFNRFELKYVVTLEAAEKFKQALCAYLTPDSHGNSSGAYPLSSLYYDSADYRFYWEKVDGIKFRRKLRIRYYPNSTPLTADTPVFVEIKQRIDRVTQKRRVLLPYGEALRLCNERQAPPHEAQDAPVVDEILHMLWMYDLRPVSLIHYARQAFVGSDYDVGLRVTFDRDLRYSTDLHELGGESHCLMLFPPEWTVVEIKVNERIPYWLTELVAMHDLKLMRVSKYCRSIELARNLSTGGYAWMDLRSKI